MILTRLVPVTIWMITVPGPDEFYYVSGYRHLQLHLIGDGPDPSSAWSSRPASASSRLRQRPTVTPLTRSFAAGDELLAPTAHSGIVRAPPPGTCAMRSNSASCAGLTLSSYIFRTSTTTRLSYVTIKRLGYRYL